MTEEQINKLEELFSLGENISNIANQIGVERHTVSRYIKKHNLINSNTVQSGQKYGRLTVIKATDERDNCGRIKWLCQCECGNFVKVNTSSLKNGNTLSCGCLKKEKTSQIQFKDLTGQRFGKLLVLERVKNTWDGRSRWKCKCDCGTIKETTGETLRRGEVISCGCIASKGEYLIREYLNKNNINFQSQYSFKDLISQKNHPLRFDFAIFKDNKVYCLIEFQGPQHTDNNNPWHTLELEYNDKEKIQYCQKHDYNLILINSIKEIEPLLEGALKKFYD